MMETPTCKKPYVAPVTMLTRVSVESSICAGSTVFDKTDEKQLGEIDSQEVNTSFRYDYDDPGDWTSTSFDR